jgi:hypothetical protein
MAAGAVGGAGGGTVLLPSIINNIGAVSRDFPIEGLFFLHETLVETMQNDKKVSNFNLVSAINKISRHSTNIFCYKPHN